MAFVEHPLCAADEIPKALPVFEHLKNGKKQSVVVYGTSLTYLGEWAVALKDWFDTNYPGLVQFANSARPGQNSDWGLANLKARVLNRKPDLVFLEFSFNDAADRSHMTVEQSADNLGKIVTAIREARPECTIVLQTMNVPWDKPGTPGSWKARPSVEAYNDVYRHYAQQHGLLLMDHYPQYLALMKADPEEYKKLVPDGSHPSKEGNMKAAWPTILKFLEAQKKATEQPSPKL